MKDYFDCYTLIKENVMDAIKVKEATKQTFDRRNTKLSPLEDYSDELSPIGQPSRKGREPQKSFLKLSKL